MLTLSFTHTYSHPFILPFIHLSIHHLSVSIYLSVHSSSHLFLSLLSLNSLLIHLSTLESIHPSTHTSICPGAHLSWRNGFSRKILSFTYSKSLTACVCGVISLLGLLTNVFFPHQPPNDSRGNRKLIFRWQPFPPTAWGKWCESVAVGFLKICRHSWFSDVVNADWTRSLKAGSSLKKWGNMDCFFLSREQTCLPPSKGFFPKPLEIKPIT